MEGLFQYLNPVNPSETASDFAWTWGLMGGGYWNARHEQYTFFLLFLLVGRRAAVLLTERSSQLVG